jgi:Na+-transporting methylmalonyl-CoA/oxaloacetate decarboxylase gamma subunit
MNKLKRIMITGFAALLLPLLPLAAQGELYVALEESAKAPESAYEPYDPLIPQSFAFDKSHGIFAGINNVDNEIVILSHKGNGKLEIAHRFLVDKARGRHDVHLIYRPKSVAIYDGCIAFLASHRDSCYFAVLDLNGKLVNKLNFEGYASAFSYSPSANELYISGENATGFDVIVLDTRNGIKNVKKENVLTLHHQKTRMSEKISAEDPWGIGMAVIAMSVVFLALLTLYLVFKQVGVQLIAMQERRSRKPAEIVEVKPKQGTVASTVAAGDALYAAIAAAIHLYGEELHDVENTVLTINKVSRTYSPWSSKIHGLNTYFKR